MPHKRLALLLICAACARDLAVPPLSQRPVITSFSPTSAFADSLLTITGKNFDPNPGSNVVQFGSQTARGYAFDSSGNLQVYVPEVAFSDISGNISVSNENGSSGPSPQSFSYLGRGHPYLGVPAGTTRFLHRPVGVAAAGGQIIIGSTVAWAAMGSAGFFQSLPTPPSALAGLPDGSAAFVAAGTTVSRINGASADLTPVTVRFLAASPDSTRLLAAGSDPLGAVRVVSLNPADLTVASSATLPGFPLAGLAALDDGRAALADASGVTLIDPAAAAGKQHIAAPSALAGPVAVVNAGVAAAFADGTLAVLGAGASPSWSAAINTGSAEAFASLAGSGDSIAGAKTVEGVARVIRTDTGAITSEHLFNGKPNAVAWSGGQVLVANDSVNTVEVMDPLTGNITGRASFSLRLGGTLGCEQGSAVEEDPRPEHMRYQFLSVARATNQLYAIDYNQLTVQQPMPLQAGSSPVRGVVMPGVQGVWIVHDVEIGRMQDDDTEQILTSDLPGTQCMLFTDSAGAAIVVLRPQDVSVLRDKTVTAQRTMPGTVLSGLVRPDGKIVIFYGDASVPGASPKARLYTLDELEHGGGPDAQFDGTSQYQGFIGAYRTYFGPMLFFTWDAQANAAGSFGVPLDDALAMKPTVDTLIPEDGVVRVTPDGSYYVWRRRNGRDNLLQVLSAWDLSDVYGYEAYNMDGQQAAPAFDSSGQYMYVPEPDLDEIQTFQ